MYTETTLRKKARKVGYRVEKGVQHYMDYDGPVTDENGDRIPGYEVMDLATGFHVPGCYNKTFTHLWQLEDVEEFLKKVYKKYDLEW